MKKGQKRRRSLLLIWLGINLILTLTLSGCMADHRQSAALSDQGQSSQEEQTDAGGTETLQTNGGIDEDPFVLAVSAKYPPYVFINEDEKYDGIDINIGWYIAKVYGVELQVQDMERGELIGAVSSAGADAAACGISISKELDEYVDFSVPYASSSTVVVVPEHQQGLPESADELESFKEQMVIGVEDDSTAYEWCREQGYEYVSFSDTDMMWEKLEDGEIDCVLSNQYEAKTHIEENAAPLKIIDGEVKLREYAFAVAKGNQELLDDINAAIEVMKENGKIDEFIKYYSGKGTNE